MNELVVSRRHSPVQRALVHHWQMGGFLLVLLGLVACLVEAIGVVLPVLTGGCLLLFAAATAARVALHRQRYELGAHLSFLGASLSLMVLLVLLPMTLADGLLESPAQLGALGVVTAGTAIAVALAGAAHAEIGCRHELRNALYERVHLRLRDGVLRVAEHADDASSL